MNKTIAIRIIAITGILFPILWIVNYFKFQKWNNDPNTANANKLSAALKFSMVFCMVEMAIICFLFYEYGRNFIHVMGTFY